MPFLFAVFKKNPLLINVREKVDMYSFFHMDPVLHISFVTGINNIY